MAAIAAAMQNRQPSQHPVPKIWLMTDPRLGQSLLKAIQHLPMRSGVVFRHYQLTDAERRTLFHKVRRICARRGHILLLAGSGVQSRRWHADGFHGRRTGQADWHSAPVHAAREIEQAKRMGADILFLSPLFPTQSHPSARSLGLARFMILARLAYPAKVIALGGMTRNRARALDARRVHGWAAIDAFGK
jgi:thiamine-phosphate pyrophosphorylase